MDDPQISDIERSSRTHWRSILRALAARDWIGIGIELIVVTAGVLFAFQINQWAERQKQVRDEHEFLERLYGENRQAITELGLVVQGHRKSMEQIGAALRARGNPALLADYSKRPRFGCLGAVLPSVGFSDTAFQEIVGSGKLNLVSDPELRSSLRDLVASEAAGVAQLEYGRQMAGENMAALDPYQRFDIPANPDERPPCNMDWPALLQDQRAINAAARLYRVQQLMLAARTRELAKNEEVERKLACYLHHPGCAAG
jgi:hypothetical protein